jgi:hypothetical protein
MRIWSFRFPLISVQCTAIAIGMAIVALQPPESGRMLLVPIWSGSEGRAAQLALNSGVTLIGVGPLRGSVVVRGKRAVLADSAWNENILMMAAPSAGCGASGSGGSQV